MSTVEQPNILFVTLDQFRGACLSAAGHPVVETPNLDRLAAGGLRFANHYANCAPCGPSRASIWTGLYLMNHRSVFNGTPLDAAIPNLAQLVREIGYDPVLFGYTDTTMDPRQIEDPDDVGLLDWERPLPGMTVGTMLPEVAQPWLDWLAENGYDFADAADATAADETVEIPEGRGASWQPSKIAAEHSETAFIVGELMDWVDENYPVSGDEDKAWFAHASILRPHPPFVAHAGYHDMYDPADVDDVVGCATPEEEAAIHPFIALALSYGFVSAPADELDRRQLRATYYGMIREVDDQMGRLFTWLDDTGRAENTVIIVTSDHGEQMGDHHLISKLGFHEESYYIPLIVSAPGRIAEPGRVVDAFTENVDLLPTMAELCGAELPPHGDGASLLPFFEGDEAPAGWRDAVHYEFDYRALVGGIPLPEPTRIEDCTIAVLRDAEGCYVHAPADGPAFFDMVADPHQTVNLAADPERAAQVLGYAQRLLDLRMRAADTTLANTIITPGGPRRLRTRRAL